MESSVEWNLAFGHAQNLESNIGALFNENFVSGYEAKEIVGITEHDNKSTASRFKPPRLVRKPAKPVKKQRQRTTSQASSAS